MARGEGYNHPTGPGAALACLPGDSHTRGVFWITLVCCHQRSTITVLTVGSIVVGNLFCTLTMCQVLGQAPYVWL